MGNSLLNKSFSEGQALSFKIISCISIPILKMSDILAFNIPNAFPPGKNPQFRMFPGSNFVGFWICSFAMVAELETVEKTFEAILLWSNYKLPGLNMQ